MSSKDFLIGDCCLLVSYVSDPCNLSHDVWWATNNKSQSKRSAIC